MTDRPHASFSLRTFGVAAVSLAALLGASAHIGACAAGQVRADGPSRGAGSSAATPRLAGSLDGIFSAVIVDDPLPGADVPTRIAWALDVARATTAESYDADEALESVSDVPATLSPQRAAWYRVDEAINLATVASSPSPIGPPVSVAAQRSASRRAVKPGHLRLYVPKARERYDIELYDASGRMRLPAIVEATRALRDHGSQVSRSVSPRLLAMLYLVGQHFDAELQIISGYRVRGVNASRGSRHGSAEACDFRIEGVGIRTIADYAETTFAQLGMGVYPTSGFVHMDTRQQTFYWQDSSGPGQRSRTRARAITQRGNPTEDVTLRSVHMTEREVYAWPSRSSE